MADLLSHLRKLVLVHEDLCLEMETVAKSAEAEDSDFASELLEIKKRTESIADDVKRIADQVVSESTFELEVGDPEAITSDWDPMISITGEDTMPSPFGDEGALEFEDNTSAIDDMLQAYLDSEQKKEKPKPQMLFEGTVALQKYACKNLNEVKLAGIVAQKARPYEEVLRLAKINETTLQEVLARFIQRGLVRKRKP